MELQMGRETEEQGEDCLKMKLIFLLFRSFLLKWDLSIRPHVHRQEMDRQLPTDSRLSAQLCSEGLKIVPRLEK